MLRPIGHIARVNGDDLRSLSELVEAGQVSPVIEHRYALAELGEAMRPDGPRARARKAGRHRHLTRAPAL